MVGCIPEWNGQLLLCRRAIEPRRGYWTAPAGFMEIGETLQQAAARETREEAMAEVEIRSPLAIVHALAVHQVHVLFRARLLEEKFGAGVESLDVALFDVADIPWEQIAFRSVDFALRRLLEDRDAPHEPLHFAEFAGRAPG
ncbi:MAG: NUDIX domain-containing protein [Steroidobacteraceae bacterium]